MSIISAGDTGVALPEISNSLRFDGSNDYLSLTFIAQSSATTKTLSLWFKRSKLGAQQYLFSSVLDGNNFGGVYINSSDKLCFYSVYTASVQVNKVSTQVLRDPSAWQHLVVQMDTTQATATDRVKFYLNGVQVTAFDTNSVPMAQNATVVAPFTLTNSTWVTHIGQVISANYLAGYVANICLVDNAVKAPSDFAYTDPNGQWRSLSKAALQSIVNTDGTASFLLPFDNGSSTTTLGADASSKGNNWTLTNMVRDGSVNDCWSYDTPTNNFAVLSPIDKQAAVSLNSGNLRSSLNSNQGSRASFTMSAGKWYCESVADGTLLSAVGVGVCKSADPVVYVSSSTGFAYYSSAFKVNNNSVTAYGATWTVGDIIGLALDLDTGTLEFYKNGVSQGIAFTGLSGEYMFAVMTNNSGSTNCNFNFGQRPVASGQWYPNAGGYFRYAPPTGYKALSTKNLPDGSVTTSGSFTGNVAADGPFVWINGTPTAMTINGNAVTFGTHADKLANGFKLRTASTSYNNSGSNTYSVTSNSGVFKYNNAEGNP